MIITVTPSISRFTCPLAYALSQARDSSVMAVRIAPSTSVVLGDLAIDGVDQRGLFGFPLNLGYQPSVAGQRYNWLAMVCKSWESSAPGRPHFVVFRSSTPRTCSP